MEIKYYRTKRLQHTTLALKPTPPTIRIAWDDLVGSTTKEPLQVARIEILQGSKVAVLDVSIRSGYERAPWGVMTTKIPTKRKPTTTDLRLKFVDLEED